MKLTRKLILAMVIILTTTTGYSTQHLKIGNDENNVIKEDEKSSIYKPEITIKNDIVYVSKKLNGKQSMDIEIYYEGYDLAYSEKFKEVFSISRAYDFSTSKRGRYVIHIMSEGKTYKNTINI